MLEVSLHRHPLPRRHILSLEELVHQPRNLRARFSPHPIEVSEASLIRLPIHLLLGEVLEACVGCGALAGATDFLPIVRRLPWHHLVMRHEVVLATEDRLHDSEIAFWIDDPHLVTHRSRSQLALKHPILLVLLDALLGDREAFADQDVRSLLRLLCDQRGALHHQGIIVDYRPVTNTTVLHAQGIVALATQQVSENLTELPVLRISGMPHACRELIGPLVQAHPITVTRLDWLCNLVAGQVWRLYRHTTVGMGDGSTIAQGIQWLVLDVQCLARLLVNCLIESASSTNKQPCNLLLWRKVDAGTLARRVVAWLVSPSLAPVSLDERSTGSHRHELCRPRLRLPMSGLWNAPGIVDSTTSRYSCRSEHTFAAGKYGSIVVGADSVIAELLECLVEELCANCSIRGRE